MDLLLLPSPLLGPASWQPVARVLGAPVADTAGATTAADVLAAYERAATGLRRPVLVPHSNAGLYAPLVAERVGAAATVYVDAALPDAEPRSGLARTAFLDRLRSLADADGLLPPWTQWWPEGVDELFPDTATRAEVEAGQPRLPLSYFAGAVEVPAGWSRRPSAYLAFGETYAEEIAVALRRDWPVTTLPGRHLHQLVEPAEVAASIVALAERITA